MSGLLTSLKRYAPRPANTPTENFVTASFAWILGEHPEFAGAFLAWLQSPHWLGDRDVVIPPGVGLCWETQLSLNGVFPDMVCVADNDAAILFEHKAFAFLHEGQLRNYRVGAEKRWPSRSLLVLITATPQQHAQDPDIALCWRDVHGFISGWAQGHGEAPGIFGDFLELLESEGLGPLPPISPIGLRYYVDAVASIARVKPTLFASREAWLRGELAPHAGAHPGLNPQLRDRFGRVGFDLMGVDPLEWRPGLFVGVMYNGADHGLPLADDALGPDACVILDMSSVLHSEYGDMPEYRRFVERAGESLAAGLPAEPVHHLARVNAGVPGYTRNLWHPWMVRSPLVHVLGSAQSGEDQASAFWAWASAVLGQVLGGVDFAALCKRCRGV